jgi:hypothetical protein
LTAQQVRGKVMFFAQLGLKYGTRQFLRWSTAAPAVDAGTLLVDTSGSAVGLSCLPWRYFSDLEAHHPSAATHVPV